MTNDVNTILRIDRLLQESAEELTVQHIADTLGIADRLVRQVLEAMFQLGYVDRIPHPSRGAATFKSRVPQPRP